MEKDRFDASTHRPHTQTLVREAEVSATFPALKRNCASSKGNGFFENFFGSPGPGIFRGNMPDGACSHLSGKTEKVAHVTVNKVVESYRVGKTTLLEGNTANVITSGGPRFDSFLN